MKKVALSIFAVLTFAFAGCSSDTTTPAVIEQSVTATLSGANEFPPVTTSATGTVTGKYNKNTKILTITVTHSVPNVTAGHIHKGASGTNGGVVFGFTAPFTSPISYTSPALTDAQLADLTAGLYYVNIHTATNPAGEIRGQLSLK